MHNCVICVLSARPTDKIGILEQVCDLCRTKLYALSMVFYDWPPQREDEYA